MVAVESTFRCHECGAGSAQRMRKDAKYCSPKCRSAALTKRRPAYHAKWRGKNKDRVAQHARKYLGIPEATRQRPKSCECCGADKALVHDHDHKTGVFRGWICGSCNRGLGLLGDNLKAVLRALAYLRKCGENT